ncbi:MAG: hypothetical protein OEV89_10630 [Desulfobulbaceae bacterium]|nr:hypothetical protein [Desulfobulbaceae bacterium]HIJ91143.1 hypothetical protein [Deltaproteobacteria bacterium]
MLKTTVSCALFLALLLSLAATADAATPAVKYVVSSGGHGLVLFEDGTVAGWGNNYSGQLADAGEPLPKKRMVLEPMPLTMPGKVRQLAAGEQHSLALLEDGSVWAWGRGYEGQLGIGDGGTRMRLAVNDSPGSAQPQRVSGISDAIQVVTTNTAAFALRSDGSVLGWGSGNAGLLGPGYLPPRPMESPRTASTPITIAGVSGITRIAVGSTHVLALTADGRVLSWGNNSSGELGRKTSAKDDATPQFVEGLQGVIDIAAGTATSAAITRDGSVWVWGMNLYGHLATGETRQGDEPDGWTDKPRRIAGVAQAVNVQIGSPGRHIVVLLKDGTLRAWGNSDWGQVGAGVASWSEPSVKQPKINNVKAFWASGNNTYAVKNDGTFWLWGAEFGAGYGVKGELAKQHKVPVQFPLVVGQAQSAPGSYAANKESAGSAFSSPSAPAPQAVPAPAAPATGSVKQGVDDTIDLLNKGLNVFRGIKGL